MKSLLITAILLISTTTFAGRCDDYFNTGGDSYLAAVKENHNGNETVKIADTERSRGNITLACETYEFGVERYDVALTHLDDAKVIMEKAKKRCFKLRTRAKENLLTIEKALFSVQNNRNGAAMKFRFTCE